MATGGRGGPNLLFSGVLLQFSSGTLYIHDYEEPDNFHD